MGLPVKRRKRDMLKISTHFHITDHVRIKAQKGAGIKGRISLGD
jgi:hypothetical protein